ncbi:MAG: hypothetical protein NTY35_08435 [Planctomycetota bacterium]|nr:hypothetical protein [Planctomycetota bacterium]
MHSILLRCLLLTSAATLGFAPPARAQGSDACATAQAISGNVTVNFVNQAATTDGPANSACNFSGQSQINLDVWFRWTATLTGTATVTNCGATSVDTKIAAYAGTSCPPGTPLDCDDDNCTLQTTITFACTSGSQYLIRVGSYPGAAGGAGQITVSQAGSGGPANNDCASATVIGGLGTFAFDNTAATTDGVADTLCNYFNQTQIERDVWFRWTPSVTGAHTISFCGATAVDTKVALYSGGSCPVGAAIACLDDACQLQTELAVTVNAGQPYMLRVGVYPTAAGGTGTFTIATAGGGGGDECTPPSTGPDVIVGGLTAVYKWGLVGATCGYSIGTDSCNVGTAGLSWVASTNQHPVIGQNVYRLKNGRFEQVGMGWLKHGFLALNQSLCCACQNPGGGTVLGVGCSDPYDAQLNGNQAGSGSQGGLGPRSEVNPVTGAFPYPYTTQGLSGDNIYKRVQIANADLDPAANVGATWYAEGHYIAPDDATAGNGNNNVSWRPIVVGTYASGWNLSLSGATTRRQPAIRSWQVADPGVTLTNVQADGLFVVGSRATDNGNGTWHYEYAVYNMNSDRAAGGFSVPVGPGISVTNFGFKDVHHHSGEPYSTVDWSTSNSAGQLTWSTQTFAQNANANAVRWGTLYNFRFDANVGPQNGNATLTYFKPGSPTAASVVAQVPSAAGAPVVAFCFGTGGTACPCGNSGTAGNGCANSINANGANLAASGSPSITSDTLTLSGSGMPNSSALYFQGTTQANGGLGTVFGDGLRCAAGSIIRLGTKTNAGGGSQYPSAGDLSVSVRGSNAPGNVRTYQVWYRNASAFCTGDTFNLSNGLQATWQP